MHTGSVVASRFEILGEAGAGGMGTVYRARDRESGELVALKLVRTRDADGFDGEASMLQSLTHPGIVRYIAHGREAEGPYLVMEWLEGEDLEQRLEGGALTLAESVDVVRRAAEALAEAHRRGIVHRDLKPANIWLEGGDLARVKVLDFGVARSHMTTLETTANVIVGTPAYMAPEQVRGSSMLDARADVYSLGCVLFECITGHPPFLADDIVAVLAKTLLEHPPRLKHVRSDVPAELDDLVARMLAKDPASRPSNADALAHERAFTSAMAPRAVPTVPMARSITSGEQRLACVILFGATHVDDATISTEGWGEAITKARRVVQSFGARIEVMIGGSVAVLVEGQGRATDEARRAASCALALKRATGAQAMALATGRAELGAVPLGDALDRAAALLRRRVVAGVRVDEVTASLLGDDFDMGDGVILGRRESDDVRTLLGRRTPTVGRALELERVMNAFAACTTGPHATAAVVTAAAGVGKSRLRHEIVRALRARDARAEIWIARGDAFGAGSAFGLAAQLVRRAAGVLAGEPRETTHVKLSRRVRRYVSSNSAGRVTTFLAEMIGAPLASNDDVVVATARRDAMVMYDQLRLAWEDFVGAECEAHPLVVVLDDLHWGDRPTLALLDSALRIFRDKPLFVVAFARPEIRERFPDLWAERDVVRVDLGELPRDAATELVVHALGARATPNVIARLVDRAAGNAFYLEELVRAVAEGRSETPDSALLMVQSRLEALEPEARRVLRAASVFGRAFWSGGVASLVGNAVEADAWLAKLEERELVHRRVTTKFAGEQELAFNHAIVQEAAHAMLTGADRALGHKLAAEWLAPRGEPDAMVLAEHWEAAGESQPALAAWSRAAEQALEGNDFAACVACADHGVRHEPQGSDLARLRDLQADALRWLGDNAAMASRAREATRLSARGSDAWAESASKLALAYQRLGQVSEVVTIGEELGAAMSKATPVLLSAGARTASVLALAGKRDEANRLLELVEGSAHGATEPATLARLDQARANRALFEGRVEEYVERSSSAMHAFAAAGDRRLACVASLNVGHGLLELGVSDEADELLSATIAEAERLGLRNIAGLAMQNRGWALFRLGRADEALAVMRASIEDFTKQANRRLQGFSHAYVARMLLARGDVEGALASAHEALALAESALPLRVAALAVIAASQTHLGRFPEAAAAAREALAGLEAHGVEEGEAFVRLASLRALRAAGATNESEHALTRARERLGQRLAAIHRPDWRERFSGVDENVQTWLE